MNSPRRKELNRVVGGIGEDAAARELLRRGFRILERNHVCGGGELDIIAEKDGEIVFVEVKTRSPRAMAEPRAAVDADKQRRIKAAASYYLKRFRQPSPPRFDIVSVWIDSADQVDRIELECRAFE